MMSSFQMGSTAGSVESSRSRDCGHRKLLIRNPMVAVPTTHSTTGVCMIMIVTLITDRD